MEFLDVQTLGFLVFLVLWPRLSIRWWAAADLFRFRR